MRDWRAVHRELDATEQGVLEDARNISLYIQGEIGRRNPYSYAASSAGVNAVPLIDPFGTQRVVLFTSAGAIVEEAV